MKLLSIFISFLFATSAYSQDHQLRDELLRGAGWTTLPYEQFLQQAKRLITPENAPRFYARIEQMARDMGLSKTPNVYFKPGYCNAGALFYVPFCKANVDLGSTFIFDKSDQEIFAILGHEFGHIKGMHRWKLMCAIAASGLSAALGSALAYKYYCKKRAHKKLSLKKDDDKEKEQPYTLTESEQNTAGWIATGTEVVAMLIVWKLLARSQEKDADLRGAYNPEQCQGAINWLKKEPPYTPYYKVLLQQQAPNSVYGKARHYLKIGTVFCLEKIMSLRNVYPSDQERISYLEAHLKKLLAQQA